MPRKVAIGEQDFGKILEKNCFYVDKTSFIKEWWENEDTVTLLTRPRRFGKTLMMNMLNAAFKSNLYLERGIMTGITRVSKESVFSDLNHLTVVTITSRMYETCFGFTEEEVAAALEEFSMQEQLSDVKRWYDGFQFGRSDSIYNPWSITNYLK